jgi:hypothetical protein
MVLTLHHPLAISPRLLPGLQVPGGWLTVEPNGFSQSRLSWTWRLDVDGHEFAGTDLSTGAQYTHDEAGYRAALGAMLSFLGAAAETYRYGSSDGDDPLFEESVLAWAHQNDDELSMLHAELEPDEFEVEHL